MSACYKWILAFLCFAIVPEVICQPAKMLGQWNIYQTNEYPNPLTDPTKCQTSRPSGLCDPNKMFDETTRESIIKTLEELEGISPGISSDSAKECLCNETCTVPTIKIVVAIMKKLGPDIFEYKAEIKEIAKQFKKLWKLHNCTVVFVASVNDKTDHAEAGSEVISLLNKTIDSIDKRIYEEYFLQLKAEGLNEMFMLYRNVLRIAADAYRKSLITFTMSPASITPTTVKEDGATSLRDADDGYRKSLITPTTSTASITPTTVKEDGATSLLVETHAFKMKYVNNSTNANKDQIGIIAHFVVLLAVLFICLY